MARRMHTDDYGIKDKSKVNPISVKQKQSKGEGTGTLVDKTCSEGMDKAGVHSGR